MPNMRVHKSDAGGAWSGAGPGPEERLPAVFVWAAGLLWIVLLWSWITPIAGMSEWTDPGKTVPLYAATAFFITVDMFRIPPAAGVPLKAAAAFFAVGWLFRDAGGHSGFGLDWLQQYASLSAADGRAVSEGDWETISGENRTLIFLAGWAMLAGVVQSILVHRKRALWLVVTTWSYLLVLQLWPGLDTTREILASGAAGTALLAVLHLERIRNVYATGLVRSRMPAEASDHGDATGAKPKVTWTAARSGRGDPGESVPPLLYAAALAATLLLFIGALAAAGREGGLPMKPLEYGAWDRFAEVLRPDRTGGVSSGAPLSAAAQAVTGYGDNDGKLGGPLAVKDEPVFTARTPVRTYWRGESRSYYDGSGWKGDGLSPYAGDTGAAGENMPVSGTAASRAITQEILYTGPRSLNLLFAGGEVETVGALYTLEGKALAEGVLQVDREAGRYALPADKGQLGYARFQVRLGAAGPQDSIGTRGEYPEAVKTAYLQLPDRLPERVKRLAADTAAAGQTPYAKALLIEQYLKKTYPYNLTDVPVQTPGQDFADAFLFSGKGGYCDYFSTAMAVMLRSVGVPARWVKGFAPGEQVSAEGGIMTYAVSTKDAHSWVEAYIPGEGWVAFDPTPGFTGFGSGQSGDRGELASLLMEPEPDEQEAHQSASARWGLWHEWIKTGMAEGAERILRGPREWLSRHRLPAAAVLLALGAVIYVLRTQRRLLGLLLLLHSRKRGRERSRLELKLLDRLWLQVFRRYGFKPPGQTLREYAVETGRRVPQAREALIGLVRLDEHVRYAEGCPPWLPRRSMTALWRQLFGGGSGGGDGRGVQM